MNDAHLHLQDPRLEDRESIIATMQAAGIKQCVVNGTSPQDWEKVYQISQQHPGLIIPSYGLHPWHTPQAGNDWKVQLKQYLATSPFPCIGECGLDRWINKPNKEAQEESFLYQVHLANQLNAPLTVHILQAWGWFLNILRSHPFPKRGFLLHSYNGSIELLPELINHGAYFSFSGHYLHERKMKQQETFKAIPKDRLLIETDAPYMLPPTNVITHPLESDTKIINHPANLISIAQQLAILLEIDLPSLKEQLAQNFSDFFLTH